MTKKSPSRHPHTPDKYLQFLKEADLQGIGLESIEARVDRNGLARMSQEGRAISISLDATFEILAHDTKALVTGAKFTMRQEATLPDETKMVLIKIEAAFSALFNLGISCTKVEAERFANNEAKLIFWPYLRHLITDTTYRMAITPILLPLSTAQALDRHEGQQEQSARKASQTKPASGKRRNSTGPVA